MEVIEGTLSRIIRQFDSGYTIAVIEPDYDKVVGNLPGFNLGDKLEFHGRWDDNSQYGMQFKFEHVSQAVPDDLEGVQNFLAQLPNIGPIRAEAIINEFGKSIFMILENGYQQFTKISGITKERAELIHEKWIEIKADKDTFIFLDGLGCTPRQRGLIIKKLGSKAIEIIKQNPYQLINTIKEFGFTTVDRMALKMGITEDSLLRAKAAVEYVLFSRAQQDQHTYIPKRDLLMGLDQKNVKPDRAEYALEELENEDKIVRDTGKGWVAHSYYYNLEVNIAAHLERLVNHKMPVPKNKVVKTFFDRISQTNFTLTDDQVAAAEMVLKNSVSIITGLPGTGKTTLLQTIIEQNEDLSIRLAAPTGKAAKRLEEATGRSACTIHRLLEYHPAKGFRRDEDCPLECDMLIIDEVSMLDVWLLSSLLDAVKEGTRLIMVGDADQLPSVGPGNVLADLLASKSIPSVKLEEIMRQAKSSTIIRNASRINIGFPLDLDGNNDFFFIQEEEPDIIRSKIRKLVSEKIPEKLKLDPRSDIQVLCPQNVGPLGSIMLNNTLQRILNPGREHKAQVKVGSDEDAYYLRVGDRIIQTKNNYNLGVFNGTTGYIRGIDRKNRLIEVEFPGVSQDFTLSEEEEPTAAEGSDLKTYEFGSLHELKLAYAISVHKAQGCDFPCVVIPLHTINRRMLQQNLLYTAITRGKKYVFIVGTEAAIDYAIDNDKPQKRFTHLRRFVTEWKI